MRKEHNHRPIIGGIRYSMSNCEDMKMEKGYGDWYFKPKNFEKSGKLYEMLGVRQFKKLISTVEKYVRKPLKAKKSSSHTYYLKERTIKGIKKFESGSRITETVHTIAFGALALLAYSRDPENLLSPYEWSGNVFINFYPIILQRYNRARIYNTVEKAKEQCEEKIKLPK